VARVRTPSIRLRVALASVLLLPALLGLVGWLLDQAFYRHQHSAQRESMRLQQLLLSRGADWDGRSWQMGELDEIRFSLADSGLYAFILSRRGELLWHSPSAERVLDTLPAARQALAELATATGRWRVGDSDFGTCELGRTLYCHRKLVAWGSAGPEQVFLLAQTRDELQAARDAYRRNLASLLAVAMALLVAAQLLIFGWGMRPLRRLAAQLQRLEKGESAELHGAYPRELQPLVTNLNQLLHSERARRQRVRNTMDRLAHVLKSPLMLLRNSTEGEADYRRLVDEQVSRMLAVVEGELARARLDGRPTSLLGKPVPVLPVLRRIAEAYARLPRRADHAGTGDVAIDTAGVDATLEFRGEERDLQDLFGSLLENAIRHCRERVLVEASAEQDTAGRWFVLAVGDDGAGVPSGLEREILQRGARADSAGGHGLGLSIVVDIASAYGGSVQVGASPLGGACFTVRIPQGERN